MVGLGRARSPRPLERHGSRNSQGSSPPIFRVVCGAQPQPQDAAAAGREMQNRRTPNEKAHYRSDIPPFQRLTVLPRGTVVLLKMHRGPHHTPRQRSVLAAFGSSTSTGAASLPERLQNGARHRPLHRRSQTFWSNPSGSGLARVADR